MLLVRGCGEKDVVDVTRRRFVSPPDERMPPA
jgi:hypothetical protein